MATASYATIEADRVAKMTPSELADYNHGKDKTAIGDLEAISLPAVFTKMVLNEDTGALEEGETWQRPVLARMEYREECESGLRRILHFENAVTGHEAFEINDRVLAMFDEASVDLSRTWMICAGSASYDRCEIRMVDIAAFVGFGEARREALMKTVHGGSKRRRSSRSTGGLPRTATSLRASRFGSS